jgi:hypothetical protein
MDIKSPHLSAYESIYAVLPPTSAASTSTSSEVQPLITLGASTFESEDARAIDDFELEVSARVKSFEYVVSSFQMKYDKELTAENERLKSELACLTAENSEYKAKARELEEDSRLQKARAAILTAVLQE